MQKVNQNQFKLAELIQGLDVELRGDPNCLITGISVIQAAEAGHITFLSNPLYKKHLAETKASAVIIDQTNALSCQQNAIVCNNPYYVYAKIANFFAKKQRYEKGIHPTAVIGNHSWVDPSACVGPNCVIGDNVKINANVIIGPGVVVGDGVQIGEGSLIDAHVTLYHDVIIGKRTHLCSGVVIGSDGFGIANHQGSWHKIPQLGTVIIGSDVDIGANTTIDRGAIEDTVIEDGVKLDNLIQVGHNVRIGSNTVIAGCVGIAGSANIGKNCMIGGASNVGGHINICDNVVVTGMSGVEKSINEPGVYSSGVLGVVTNREFRKNNARFHRLGSLIERVKKLETDFENGKEIET